MENQGRRSFYRIILNKNLENGTLEFPQEFVEEHGKNLSRYVRLEASAGEKWKVKVKRREDGIWLCKGLRDFFNYYRITYGYFLVLKYKGESVFHVRIFHPNALEIKHPCNADEEDSEHGDDVSVEILEEFPRKLHKSGKDEAHGIREEEVDVSLEILDQIPKKLHKRRKISSANQSEAGASDRILQRAKAFRSPNPHFIAKMNATCIFSHYMHIPHGHAKTYFRKKENGGLQLKGEHGSACFVEYKFYNAGVGRSKYVRLSSGWEGFVRENHLQVGDVCVFELIDSTTKTYKVNMFRTADRGDINTTDASYRVLQRARAFRSPNPHFIAQMKPSYGFYMHIPQSHAKTYFRKEKNGGLYLKGENGRACFVGYAHFQNKVRLVSGWTGFARENQLKMGDVSVFELIDSATITYKVTTFRIADLEEIGRNAPRETLDKTRGF